jgi:hypothetical protein
VSADANCTGDDTDGGEPMRNFEAREYARTSAGIDGARRRAAVGRMTRGVPAGPIRRVAALQRQALHCSALQH